MSAASLYPVSPEAAAQSLTDEASWRRGILARGPSGPSCCRREAHPETRWHRASGNWDAMGNHVAQMGTSPSRGAACP